MKPKGRKFPIKREELLQVGWENAVREWTSRKIPKYTDLVIKFFRRAFETIDYPEKVAFGVHAHWISLCVGNIWPAACRPKEVCLLVDRRDIHPQFDYQLAPSTAQYEPIYWLNAQPHQIEDLLQLDEVWECYKIALQKVWKSPVSRINIPRNRVNKVTLAELRALSFEKTSHPPAEPEYHDTTEFVEGGGREIARELQRRDPRVKRKVIEVYGCRCQVCGFSFEDFYGPIGQNYIEVHHLTPLSAREEETITRIEDVAAVCANCHRMLHRGGAWPMSLDELRTIVEEHKRKRGLTGE